MIGELWQSACDVVKEIRAYVVAAIPPVGTSVSTMAGITLEDSVYVVTFIYTVILILLALPRLVGCGRCLWKHHTCTMVCKREAPDNA